jgi:hypothetical protein
MRYHVIQFDPVHDIARRYPTVVRTFYDHERARQFAIQFALQTRNMDGQRLLVGINHDCEASQ